MALFGVVHSTLPLAASTAYARLAAAVHPAVDGHGLGDGVVAAAEEKGPPRLPRGTVVGVDPLVVAVDEYTVRVERGPNVGAVAAVPLVPQSLPGLRVQGVEGGHRLA